MSDLIHSQAPGIDPAGLQPMLRKLLTKLPVTSILLGLPGLHVLGQDVEAQLLVGFGFVQRESEAYHAQCRGSQAEHSNLSALPKALAKEVAFKSKEASVARGALRSSAVHQLDMIASKRYRFSLAESRLRDHESFSAVDHIPIRGDLTPALCQLLRESGCALRAKEALQMQAFFAKAAHHHVLHVLQSLLICTGLAYLRLCRIVLEELLKA
eukprot:CAMPEP_0181409284 /NCGR_PEP_ID=MMETSP1110-20121109/6739_1 /TAXON_ID=174948 /ORGANISM="Symbiodinium sp., Strain CCMP421" /LENGTH=211 /DNA_ID=CAMNT_0023531785 /DNA_START=419 /DNA_END=1056 /DNA_ORIENTATION=-